MTTFHNCAFSVKVVYDEVKETVLIDQGNIATPFTTICSIKNLTQRYYQENKSKIKIGKISTNSYPFSTVSACLNPLPT